MIPLGGFKKSSLLDIVYSYLLHQSTMLITLLLRVLATVFCRWISCFSQCYFQYVEALSHILQAMLHQLELFGRLRKFSSRSRCDVLYSIAYTRLTVGDLDVLVAKILYHIYSTATQFSCCCSCFFPEPQFRVESALVNDLDGIDHWANWFLQLETQYHTACSMTIPQWFSQGSPIQGTKVLPFFRLQLLYYYYSASQL